MSARKCLSTRGGRRFRPCLQKTADRSEQIAFGERVQMLVEFEAGGYTLRMKSINEYDPGRMWGCPFAQDGLDGTVRETT